MTNKLLVVVTDKGQLKKIIAEAGNTEDLNYLDVSAIKDFSWLFKDSPFNGIISGWDVSNGTDFEGMFCRSKFTGDVGDFDISKGKNFRKMFQDAAYPIGIEKWNDKVSPLANIEDMFLGCVVPTLFQRVGVQPPVLAVAKIPWPACIYVNLGTPVPSEYQYQLPKTT